MSKGSPPNPTKSHASARDLRLEPVTVAGSGVPSAGLRGGGEDGPAAPEVGNVEELPWSGLVETACIHTLRT